ncbi:MAG: hypothetical protein K9L59_14225, partial [Desulfobacterales bacterium]|nr:hypothetical protein [Desulfobacterales bacterium]
MGEERNRCRMSALPLARRSRFRVCVFALCASRFAFGYAGQVAAQAGFKGCRREFYRNLLVLTGQF